MRKPGVDFEFQQHKTSKSPKKPRSVNLEDHKSHKGFRESLKEGLKETVKEGLRELLHSRPSSPLPDMVKEQAPPKIPLRPSSGHGNAGASISQDGLENDKPSATAGPGAALTYKPAIKKSALGKDLDDKYAHLFIQPKNGYRPEHHRPQRISGPLQPVVKDRKPAPPPMYSTIPGLVGSSSNPIAIIDGPPPGSVYSQPGIYSEYVDPKKAAADLKALIEGSVDDDEDKLPDDGEDRSQITGINVRLLPHQVEGVEWMKGRELGPVKKGKVPKGGILADDMGLGKTLQAISLIMSNPKPKDSPKFAEVEKTTLVVAPLALIRQWEAELKDKVTDSHRLKVLVHHGPQRSKRSEDLRRYDVVITTYQILVSEHGNSGGCFGLHWYRVILDEAHTIKNRNAKSTKACYELRTVYRWCLSGTPMQNNLDELQSLVKFLRIKPYDDLKEWKEHIELPLRNGKGDMAIRRLHSILRCFMKRRTKDILKEAGALSTGGKAGNGDDEEKSATSDFKVTERKVVPVQAIFSPAERRFYDRLEQRTDKSIESMMRSQGKVNYANALVLLLRLRQVCNHPKLVEGKIEKDKDALSTDARTKKDNADVDDLADLLGGLGVEAKHCDICGWELSSENRAPGKDMCKSCSDDLDYFNNHEDSMVESPEKKKKKKKKSKSKVKAKAKKVVEKKVEPNSDEEDEDEEDSEIVEKPVRKSKNRRAVLDSDDEEDEEDDEEEAVIVKKPARKPINRRTVIDSDEEEDEGSWIVSGDEQGPLRLGKAGGTDDENAEGEGETINAHDSESDSEDDGSRLDSFIVKDEDVKPEDLEHVYTDSEDELPSLSMIGSKAKKAKAVKHKSATESEEEDGDADSESGSGSEEDSEDGISASEFESDSEDEGPYNPFSHSNRHRNKEKTPVVLASAKIRQLLSILHKEIDEHKFIVFSQFTSMLDIVERFFRKDGIRYVRYDGSMKNDAREASLNSLRNNAQTRVLLCSLRCGALGLNLTAASRVVLLEPFWNPFVEEQAIDRVHRLTQKVDVVVYKLTVEKTVEERILELQEKKRLLAEQAIEGGMRKGALKLGVQEMMELFRPGGSYDHNDGRFSSADNVRRDAMHSMKGMMGSRKKTPESEVYGRRW